MTSVDVRVLDGFSDPALAPERWARLQAAGETDTVFQTRGWLESWWASFARGRLLLLLARAAGEPLALAPLFVDGDMGFFVGSGGSDCLDFVGDVARAGVLEALLSRAREEIRPFVGFRFHLVPDASRTGPLLREVASRLGMTAFDEGALVAPSLDLADEAAAARALGKESLRRHERALARDGRLEVVHARTAAEVVSHLDEFFEQHVRRWSGTEHPSLFLEAGQRAFYRRVVEAGGAEGWLRFTRVVWNERPVAFHLGFERRRRFLWYKPTFDVDLARRSPGEVLLLHLLRAAVAAGDETFDFGLGDEPFKARFATARPTFRTWGLYPDA